MKLLILPELHRTICFRCAKLEGLFPDREKKFCGKGNDELFGTELAQHECQDMSTESVTDEEELEES